MASILGTHAYTQSFPSDDDEPTYIIAERGPSYALGLDSMNRHQVYPPSSDYLRRLAAKASELAAEMDSRDPGWLR